MSKKPQQLSYELAKVSYGIYVVEQLHQLCSKDLPTETDIKKLLLKINPSCTANELQAAKQISRYCQHTKTYLRDAREETLNKVAILLNVPIKSFYAFREKIDPALKSSKYYTAYILQAEKYLKEVENNAAGTNKKLFCQLFACNDQSKIYLSMISYNFGEMNKDLPAISFGAESDLYTERVLRGLFDKFDLPAPQYIPDKIFMEQVATGNTDAIFIAIGLFGNSLTQWMSSTGRLVNTLEINPEEKYIRFKNKTYYASREEGVDYAVFCKVMLHSKNYVFIIGGIEGFGTQRTGEYFANHWPLLEGQTSAHTNISLLYKITEKITELIETGT